MAMRGGYQVLNLANPEINPMEVIRGSGGKRIVVSGAKLGDVPIPDFTAAFGEDESGKFKTSFLWGGVSYTMDESGDVRPEQKVGGFKYYNYAYRIANPTKELRNENRTLILNYRTTPRSLEISTSDGVPVIINGAFAIQTVNVGLTVQTDRAATLSAIRQWELPVIFRNAATISAHMDSAEADLILPDLSGFDEPKIAVEWEADVTLGYDQTANILTARFALSITNGAGVFTNEVKNDLGLTLYTVEVAHNA